MKDIEAYRLRKREYAKTPEQRKKRREYQRVWRARNHEKLREKHLKVHYGLTSADYDRMLREQESVCAICNRPTKDTYLQVDHDHSTGKFVGFFARNAIHS